MIYNIVAHLPTGKEIVDYETTLEAAEYLQVEYSMAFQCYVGIEVTQDY